MYWTVERALRLIAGVREDGTVTVEVARANDGHRTGKARATEWRHQLLEDAIVDVLGNRTNVATTERENADPIVAARSTWGRSWTLVLVLSPLIEKIA